MPQAQTDYRPLTAAEQKDLERLLMRQAAGGGPAVRIGDPYQALVNLSVPRRGDPEKLTDLVRPGETVYMTKDEADKINRRHPRPVLRPAKEATEPLPQIHPREMSGRIFAPPVPAPESDAARPDPPGSSHLVEREVRIPEAGEPQVGSENLSAAQVMDIPPRAQAGPVRR